MTSGDVDIKEVVSVWDNWRVFDIRQNGRWVAQIRLNPTEHRFYRLLDPTEPDLLELHALEAYDDWVAWMSRQRVTRL